MTNGEKYKTEQERAEAFRCYCKNELGDKYAEYNLFSIDGCLKWLDLEAEDDSVVIECNGHRYKAKNAKAHLSGDMLVITGCSGVRGDLSAEIRVEKIEQDNRIAKTYRDEK